MKQKGRVLEVKEGIAFVEIVRNSACSGECGSCGGCAHTSQKIIIETPCGNAQRGQIVTLEVKSSKVLLLAQMTYIVPLIFLIAGYFLGAGYGENTGILFGFFGLLLALPIVFYASKKAKKLLQYDIQLFE